MSPSHAGERTNHDLRVLLILEEPGVADGLRRLLQKLVPAEVHLASSPGEAIERHGEAPVDLVIADLTLYEREAPEVLLSLPHHWPAALRVLLAAPTLWQEALQGTPRVHQFLALPLDRPQVEFVVARALAARAADLPRDLRAAVGALPALPSDPSVLEALRLGLRDPGARSPDLATIVRRDAALTCRILQMANAPFFGAGSRLCDVDGALNLLGTNGLRLALEREGLAASWQDRRGLAFSPPFELDRHCRHALVVASVAKAIFRDPRAAEAAFSAGLLHGVGWLALAAAAPALAAERVEKGGLSDGLPERLASFVLNVWGLPSALIAAVEGSHREPDEETFSPASAVYLARRLASVVATADSGPLAVETPLSNRFVHRHKLTRDLPAMLDRATSALETARRTITPLPLAQS